MAFSRFWLPAAAIAALTALSGAAFSPAASAVTVTTQHNDNNRTGWNPAETVLKTGNVNVNTFGKVFATPVDGHIYAQPLYVPNLTVARGTHNVLFVATAHDSLYAIDADTGVVLWKKPMGTPVPSDVIGTPNIRVEVGIISTPVIDLATNTIYVAAKNYESNTQLFRLYAVDITSGRDRTNSPKLITASVNGTGDGNDGAGHVPFLPDKENQRPAITLAGNRIYLAFASHEDFDPYHGWVLAYDKASLAQVAVHNTSPNGSRGGIWQGGQGLVTDAANNLYLMTGNGTSDAQTAGGTGYGECFEKLTPSLGVLDWFMPGNFDQLNQADADLGSGGPVLIPGTSLIAGCGKQGVLYVVNTANMGHYNASGDAVVQEFQATFGLWGAPVFANNTLYIWGVGDTLKAFPFARGVLQTSPSSTSIVSAPFGGDPCGALSVSSNGATAGTGIVWGAIPQGDPDHDTVPGAVYAFDAGNLQHELWDSRQYVSRDDYGNFAKFCPPTIANGKVYVATDSGQVVAYGNIPFSAPPPPANLTATAAPTQVQLKWSAPAGSVTSYSVYRGTKPGQEVLLTQSLGSTSYVDGAIAPGTTYYYVVTASNQAGTGPKSNETSATPSRIKGTILSLDFTGGGPISPPSLAAADIAGFVPAAHWNTASGTAGTVGNLVDNTGNSSGANASWTCDNLWSIQPPLTSPDNIMMAGYLDDAGGGITSVTITNLSSVFTASGYDVYVYCDGDNGGADRKGGYSIGATSQSAIDTGGTTFSGTYVKGNGTAGNYVVLPNQTAASFTLSASGVSTSDGTFRAPVNGIQIVSHQPPFGVTVKSVSTGAQLNTTSALAGNLPYIDSTATLGTLPTSLSGGILVRAATADNAINAATYLTLTLNAPSTLYVCFDSKTVTRPAWLADRSWSDARMTVPAGSATMKVYSRSFPAGDVVLGGNAQPPSSTPGMTYFVIAQPQ